MLLYPLVAHAGQTEEEDTKQFGVKKGREQSGGTLEIVTALRILEAAEERGIRVPEDLSLVGYDNVSYAAIPRIHLTTVSQHKFQQGRIAVERLLCQIQGDRRPTADLLQPELVVRSTCAPRTQGGRTL